MYLKHLKNFCHQFPVSVAELGFQLCAPLRFGHQQDQRFLQLQKP